MTPTPGSEAAKALGCTCPVIDNRRGKGIHDDNGEPQFVISGDCEVHGNKEMR